MIPQDKTMGAALMMDALRLTLPVRQQGEHLLVETRPEASRAFLEALPYGDMRLTLPKVLKSLASLNRTELPAPQRMSLMPDYENSFHLIASYYHRGAHPSAPHKPALPERLELQQLTREMCFAYKLVVNDFLERKSAHSKSKVLVKAVYAAVHYLGLMLMGFYENYAPAPVHLWRELYGLYTFSVHHELQDADVEAEDLRGGLPTIGAEFKRICLLAISDPYHLSRSEHWEIYHYLSYWVDLASLDRYQESQPSRHHFLIDLAGGGKPTSPVPNKRVPAGAHWWLNTKFLVARIHQHLETLGSHPSALNIGFSSALPNREAQQILLCLQRAWDEHPERAAPRFPKINRADLIWNLAAIHALYQSLDPLSPGQHEPQPKISTFDIAALDHEQARHLGWEAVNGSEGGLCLTQHGTPIHQLEVGQLAALREHVDGKPSSRWSLAVLRWLHGDQRQTTLGLEFIRGDVQVVSVHALHGNKIDTRPKPAFLISGQEVQGITTPTVIAPRGLYQEGRMLLLQIGDEQLYIHARNRVEITGGFERFFYQTFEPSDEQLRRDFSDRLEDEVMIDFNGHDISNSELDWDKF